MHTGDYFAWNNCAVCESKNLNDVATSALLDWKDDRGKRKASICRSNKCGRYGAANDTCGVLVERGKRGAVSWLYSHSNAACPNDPPMWKVDNGSDEMEARKSKP